MISMLISVLVGAAIGGGGVYVWHRKTILKVNPRPNTGSGGQPGPH